MKIGIIGAGISGLGAALTLQNHGYDVTVIEAENCLGGHANTHDTPIPVDTGFIVYNPKNYPNLIALFDYLGVETAPTDMSFAASLPHMEYGSRNLNEVFGQRKNIISPTFWRMIRDILKFFKTAPAQLVSGIDADISLGDWLAQNGYSKTFVHDHLLPMGGAIWSTDAAKMLDYPARSFLQFFENHGLLMAKNRPPWRTVVGGSKQYVSKIEAKLDKIIKENPATDVSDNTITLKDANQHTFDKLIFACHADQALHLIDRPSAEQKSILSSFTFQKNKAVLHSDVSLMPKTKRVWSAWNFLQDSNQKLCVTYWMNVLQPLQTDQNLFVTLNPIRQPKGVITQIDYMHPVFDKAAIKAQNDLNKIQGINNYYFCGAWTRYGFHEDGLSSGLKVAELLGAQPPWK